MPMLPLSTSFCVHSSAGLNFQLQSRIMVNVFSSPLFIFFISTAINPPAKKIRHLSQQVWLSFAMPQVWSFHECSTSAYIIHRIGHCDGKCFTSYLCSKWQRDPPGYSHGPQQRCGAQRADSHHLPTHRCHTRC